MTSVRRSRREKSGASSSGRHVAAESAPPNEERLFTQIVNHFARTWHQLGMPLRSQTVVVACSGGADSAAALLLVRHIAPQLRLVACYVDHGLRSKSAIAADIRAVRAQAKLARAGVLIQEIRLQTYPRNSLEARARSERYRALTTAAESQNATYIVLGHHADDLAETALLAMTRGTGIDGFAGMQATRLLTASVTLVRPLLWASKKDLAVVTRHLRAPIAQDETNADTALRRNAVRAMLAQWENTVPGVTRNVARSAMLAADERSLLESVTRSAHKRCMHAGGPDLEARKLRKLPIALLRRVIRHAIKIKTGTLRDVSLEHCDAIARAIESGRGGTYHAGAARVQLSSGIFHITKPGAHDTNAPRLSEWPVDLHALKGIRRVVTPYGAAAFRATSSNGSLTASRAASNTKRDLILQLDLDRIVALAGVTVRFPRTGDSCIPQGHHRPVGLARFLGKVGVPRMLRRYIPLLCAENRIVAALGVTAMEPFAAKRGSAILEVAWEPLESADT